MQRLPDSRETLRKIDRVILQRKARHSRMTDLVNCSAFADSLDLTATAGAGFAGFIFDAIQSAIDIGVARYDLNVLARLRERN